MFKICKLDMRYMRTFCTIFSTFLSLGNYSKLKILVQNSVGVYCFVKIFLEKSNIYFFNYHITVGSLAIIPFPGHGNYRLGRTMKCKVGS